MINLKNKVKAPADLWIITRDYENLWWDDGPIVWTGRNLAGQRVIASGCYEDPEHKIEQNFYAIIDNQTYKEFLAKKISLRTIYERSVGKFIVVEREFSGNAENGWFVNFADVSDEYLPTKDSFYRRDDE